MSSMYLHLSSILPQNPQHQFHQKYIPPNPNVRPPPPLKQAQHQSALLKTKAFPQKVSGPSGSMREGDWICDLCNNLNFSFRTECNRCQQKTRESNTHHSQNNHKHWIEPFALPNFRQEDQLYNLVHNRDALKEISENYEGNFNTGGGLPSTASTSKRGSHSSEGASPASEYFKDEPGFHYKILVVPASFKNKSIDFENIAQASQLIDNKYLGEDEYTEEISHQRGTKSIIDFNNLPNIKFLF